MLIQNLGRRLEKQIHHLPGFDLSVMPTLDEVFMNDIVKVCQKHGSLTENQVRIRTPNNISCKQCARDSVNRYRKQNRVQLLIKEQEYRDKNREKLRERDRIYKKNKYHSDQEYKKNCRKNAEKFYSENRQKTKSSRLKKKYGITLDQYLKMRESQNDLCYMCNQPETAFHKGKNEIKDLCIDHDHQTGKVRALLCNRCNCLIGYANESIDRLLKAVKYLKEFK